MNNTAKLGKIRHLHIKNFRSIHDATIDIRDDYTLFVGKNNAGKSAVIDALRIFFGDSKYNDKEDKPKNTEGADSSIFIEITDYLNKKETFKGKEIKELHKQVNVIYIPAMTTSKEETKTTGPSPLQNILKDIFAKAIDNNKDGKDGYGDIKKNIQKIIENPVEKLCQQINELTSIKDWQVKMKLDVKSISADLLIKHFIETKFRDQIIDADLDLENHGHGLQRQVIFELIKFYKTIEADDRLNILLFEEPEIYMHPLQQENMMFTLKELSKQTNFQVFIVTHSPIFIGRSLSDIQNQIIRLERDKKGKTKVFQPDENFESEVKELDEEFRKASMTNGDNAKKEAKENEYSSLLKMKVWLDCQRSALFFADRVLLVEGTTEKVLFEYLIENNQAWQAFRKEEIAIVEVMGKFNFHRFMRLLEAYGIKHGVIFDKDSEKNNHKEINKFIKNKKNDHTLGVPEEIPGDIEKFLGLEKSEDKKRRDLKPMYLLKDLEGGKITGEKLNELKEIVEKALKLENTIQ